MLAERLAHSAVPSIRCRQQVIGHLHDRLGMHSSPASILSTRLGAEAPLGAEALPFDADRQVLHIATLRGRCGRF